MSDQSKARGDKSTGTEESPPQGILFGTARLKELLDGVVADVDQLEGLVGLDSEGLNSEGLDAEGLDSEGLVDVSEENSADESVAKDVSTDESGSVEVSIDESVIVTPEISVMIVGHVISNELDWPTIMQYLEYGSGDNGKWQEE